MKISEDDLNRILNEGENKSVCSKLRLGQAYFDVLAEINRDLAFEISGTNADPYYRDENISRFFDWLMK